MGNDILNVRCRDAESSQEPDPHPDPFTYPDAVSVDGSEVGDLKKDLIKRHILARDAEATRRWADARDEHELMVDACAKLFGAIDPAKARARRRAGLARARRRGSRARTRRRAERPPLTSARARPATDARATDPRPATDARRATDRRARD